MTLNLATIFGAETVVTMPGQVADRPVEAVEDMRTIEAPTPLCTSPVSWPITGGTEHFSIWVDDPAGQWPEFIPGKHYDIRQASRLRPLCSL